MSTASIPMPGPADHMPQRVAYQIVTLGPQHAPIRLGFHPYAPALIAQGIDPSGRLRPETHRITSVEGIRDFLDFVIPQYLRHTYRRQIIVHGRTHRARRETEFHNAIHAGSLLSGIICGMLRKGFVDDFPVDELPDKFYARIIEDLLTGDSRQLELEHAIRFAVADRLGEQWKIRLRLDKEASAAVASLRDGKQKRQRYSQVWQKAPDGSGRHDPIAGTLHPAFRAGLDEADHQIVQMLSEFPQNAQ